MQRSITPPQTEAAGTKPIMTTRSVLQQLSATSGVFGTGLSALWLRMACIVDAGQERFTLPRGETISAVGIVIICLMIAEMNPVWVGPEKSGIPL